ncbi:TlpA family protein disulfide reductase [Psychroflexus sp. YR1-1]|uniref:TlpA family protein disulfide reductase n=1 Tax=Psychroflexus aurantiacus TaxID=2709310 RepID=A0A6B3R676_9FLAO|nr:TlpA disulfide reductase family protein [Psychroflexus aurantiacus]NEV95040.1 TlpA family protein disulfide reductase [Psychroflexus aurantiacus]
MDKTKLLITAIILFFGISVIGQNQNQITSTVQVNEMIEVYNKKQIEEYVDYLLPRYYKNDQAKKEKFVEIWKKILKNDSDKFTYERLIKSTKSGDQIQSLFQINFRENSKSYIVGISEDEGETWKFSQPINENAQFGQILKSIPTLDHSFAKIIDPEFGHRLKYEIGETISPFNYSDIYGNEISSESIKDNVIVLNFWGTWCAPCIKEIPELNELVKKFKSENVSFIAPAINTSRKNLINNFLPINPFSYSIVLIDQDKYNITSFPTHIVINNQNVVVDIIKGYSKANVEKLENTIQKAL